jgi:hypothetical protein
MPDSLLELDNIEAAKKMVEHGIGISLVPDSGIMADLANGILAVVDVVDTTLPRREIVAVRRRDAGPPSGNGGDLHDHAHRGGGLLVGGDFLPIQPSSRPTSRSEPPMPALDT